MANRGAAILDWGLVVLMIVVACLLVRQTGRISMANSPVSSQSGS